MLNNILGSLPRLANTVAIGANAIGTLVVLGLVAVVNFDIVARGVFHAPFMGAVEVVQFSMVLIVFLQLPDVVRANRLTRSDGLLAVVATTWPGLARLIGRLIDFVSCLFMLVIAIAIWPQFVELFETGDYFGIPGVFTAPWWPLKLVVFASAALCSLLFALKIVFPDHQNGLSIPRQRG